MKESHFEQGVVIDNDMILNFARENQVSPSLAHHLLKMYAERLELIHKNFLDQYPSVMPFIAQIEKRVHQQFIRHKVKSGEYRWEQEVMAEWFPVEEPHPPQIHRNIISEPRRRLEYGD